MSYKDKLNRTYAGLKTLGKENPEQMQKFMELGKATTGDGVLSHKEKELIAVACAVVSRCDHCVAYHVKAAIDAGATKEEIMESSWVAVMMSGGPGVMYASEVRKAIEELSE